MYIGTRVHGRLRIGAHQQSHVAANLEEETERRGPCARGHDQLDGALARLGRVDVGQTLEDEFQCVVETRHDQIKVVDDELAEAAAVEYVDGRCGDEALETRRGADEDFAAIEEQRLEERIVNLINLKCLHIKTNPD